MTELEDFIITTKTKLLIQQGQIELVMSMLVARVGKEEFMNHLKVVVEAPGFSKEAKYAAAEMLRQDALWPPEQIEGMKQ